MCVSARAYFGACMSERKREREIKGVRMETRDTVKQLGIKKKRRKANSGLFRNSSDAFHDEKSRFTVS